MIHNIYLNESIQHEGFSYIDVIQPCITWGTHSVDWYKERVFRLNDDYDTADQKSALDAAISTGERLPIGVLYQGPSKKIFAHRFRDEVAKDSLTTLTPPTMEKIGSILSEFRT